jgi:two-component system sensor histidine kinase KdpD
MHSPNNTREWLFSILNVAACTGAAALMFPYFEAADLAMIYLLGVVITAGRTSTWPSLFSALLSVASFDYFFVPPYYTFSVSEVKYLVTFIVMFVVSIVISRLTLQLRQHAEETHKALLKAETESLRSTLLSSVSHDLRTPLTAITGAVSTLLRNDVAINEFNRQELLQTIQEEAERLNRMVKNVLDMTRLESGAIKVKKEWQSLEEIVGVVLNRLSDRLNDHPLTVNIPGNLPLIPSDGLLLEQLFMNLFENAIKYTPRGTPLELSAFESVHLVTVELADRGPGIPPGDEDKIFEKFVHGGGAGGGVGLGLAVCQAIIVAHGGKIWAENRSGGGAVFRFTLPAVVMPPLPKEVENEVR